MGKMAEFGKFFALRFILVGARFLERFAKIDEAFTIGDFKPVSDEERTVATQSLNLVRLILQHFATDPARIASIIWERMALLPTLSTTPASTY